VEDWVLERLQEYVGRNDREALAPRVEESLTFQSMGSQSSYRVARSLPVLGRGLVVTEEGVVPDYARVRRVFHLTNAITKYYYSPFFLEAQVPGFHARVAWLGGRQVGFTRDGRYCAFTTDRAPDFIPDAFFEEHPDLVVCLAIEGRGIPYAKPSYRGSTEDIVAWGTEILEQGVREPVSTAEKYRLLEAHGIRCAEHVGPFEAGDVDEILAWMKEFEAGGGTGVVLKPSERHHRPLKYALSSALTHGAPAWLGLDHEIEEDPYFERLLQAACAATETGMPPEDWDWEAVGKSLLQTLARAAEQVAGGGSLSQQYSVWLHHEESAELLLEQLEERTLGTSIRRLELEPDNDGWRLRFERRFAEATAALERRLSGASYRD
jgi:putative ATP-dependent DNA ligase